MNAKLCADRSVAIVTEYYKNNVDPYLDAMSENVIWHGPAIGQRIEGLDNMRKAWSSEQNGLTFSLGDMDVQYLRTSPSSCEVMLMYVVTTHYPNGDAIPLFQRIQFSWADCNFRDENDLRKRIAKIFMVHISNPGEQHSEDFIYPVHFNEIYKNSLKPIQTPRISLNGIDNVSYVITLSSFVWAESTHTQHSRVHLKDRVIEVRTSITGIENQTTGHLVRVHSGYIVNPDEMTAIKRFSITMSDGSVLPIPEKRYTQIKKLLLKGNDPL